MFFKACKHAVPVQLIHPAADIAHVESVTLRNRNPGLIIVLDDFGNLFSRVNQIRENNVSDKSGTKDEKDERHNQAYRGFGASQRLAVIFVIQPVDLALEKIHRHIQYKCYYSPCNQRHNQPYQRPCRTCYRLYVQ